MKKIHLMVLKAFIGPFILTFFIALFVLLMQFVWKYVDDLVGKGLEWYHIARLMFYASSTFVPLALPLAILLSSIMTFGNLGENYELVAMKSAGISLGKAMMPLIVLSVFISIGAFFFNNGVLPVANLKFKSLLYDIRKQKLAINIQPGIFYSGIDNYVIRVDSKNDKTNTLYGVMVYDHSDQMGNMKLSTAGKGHMYLTPDEKYLIFTLYRGENYTEQFNERNYRNRRQFQIITYDENRRKFDLYGFGLQRTNEELFRSNYQMMNIEQLSSAIDSLGRDFNGRVKEFSNSVTGRFAFLQLVDTSHRVPDSVKPTGTFFDHFKPASRKRVLETTLQNLRSNKEFVVNNANELKVRTTTLNRHKVVWHQKFTLSVACLLFFFIGAPLGAIVRKGGLGLPVVMSSFIFVIFHIISITGEKYAVSGAAEIIPAIWIGPAVLLPAGLWLSWKAITDSPILDPDTYLRFFNLFIPKKYRFKVADDTRQS